MKNVLKLARRLVLTLLCVFGLLPILNLVVLFSVTYGFQSNGRPYSTAEEVAAGLTKTADGYRLPEEIENRLKEEHVWAFFAEDATGKVLWHTDNLPEEMPLTCTPSMAAELTRGCFQDSPTFPAAADGGLVIIGYQKQTFWKHLYPAWDYNMVKYAVPFAVIMIAVNIGIVIFIYLFTDMKLLKSVVPIVEGVENLAKGRSAYIPKKGLLSDIAGSLNQASEILQSRNRELRKKETARANWIAGVSHDIRTPLSMIMGYAGHLLGDANLTDRQKKELDVICRQSQRMKNLVNDLNLASKLEYNMQPTDLEEINIVAVVRQTVVDFINTDPEEKYPIQWLTEDSLGICLVEADKGLIGRAAGNLLQNSINHNPEGCSIYVTVEKDKDRCRIRVEDDGQGITEEQLEKLNHEPHYMMCDENVTGQRHGLGLLIVRQIAQVHGGTMQIGHSRYGGFEVIIDLPCRTETSEQRVSY